MSRLEMTAGPTSDGQVLLDGTDISSALRGVTLKLEAGSMPTAVLDVIVYDGVKADGETHLAVPEKTAALLVSMGWTPPAPKDHHEEEPT